MPLVTNLLQLLQNPYVILALMIVLAFGLNFAAAALFYLLNGQQIDQLRRDHDALDVSTRNKVPEPPTMQRPQPH